MLASLQETLSFVQNMQESLTCANDANSAFDVAELKQSWQEALDRIDLPEEIKGQASTLVDHLCRKFVNKVLEVSLYRQAIDARGNDAQ